MATKKKSLLLFSGGRARGRESSGSEVWFAFQAPGFLPALVSPRSECGRQPFPAHLDRPPFVYTSCHPVTWHVGAGAELAFLAVAGDPLWAQSLPFLSSVHRAFLHSPLFPAKPGSVKRVESERESMCSD